MNRKERKALERQYKRLGKSLPSQGAVNAQSGHTQTVEVLPIGPPGVLIELQAVAQDGANPDIHKLSDRTPRSFEVTVFLKKDSFLSSTIELDKVTESGSSYLQFPAQAAKVILDVPEMSVRLTRNANSEVSSLAATIEATSDRQAIQIFMDRVTPALDHISFHYNIPMVYDDVRASDSAHKTWFVTVISPYVPVLLQGGLSLSRRLVAIYSLYREAKNTNSPFYKILCYSKILEGLIRSIRPALFAEGREKGKKIMLEREVVPDDKELRFSNKEHIGRPIIQLYEEVLQPIYRDASAHFALDGAPPVNVSNYQEMRRFADKVFLFEQCCRVLIVNTETMIHGLEQGPNR